MKKKIKVRWKNLGLAMVILLCLLVIVHDMYMITVYSWLTGTTVSFTYFGFITFVLAIGLGETAFENFR